MPKVTAVLYLFLGTLLPAGIQGLEFEKSPLVFSVDFTDQGVSFDGKVDSEETGQAIADAVRSVRPDLAVINKGLKVDPTVVLPSMTDMRSLVAELGLSTHEGRLEIREKEIIIGGLTDSLVTQTAMKIRLAPILDRKRLINRLCIVNSNDLPNIKISLSSGERKSVALDFDIHLSASEAFEPPGLLVEKLFPTLIMLTDFDRLEGKTPAAPAKPAPLRAMPLAVGETAAEEPTAAPIPLFQEGPKIQYETLPSIRFSRNSFFLQANQQPIIAEIAKILSRSDLSKQPVTLEAIEPRGGSAAFNDYLSERRSEEVKKLLTQSGAPLGDVTFKTTRSDSAVDTGEVRIIAQVKLPEPEPAPEPIEETAETEPAEVPVAE